MLKITSKQRFELALDSLEKKMVALNVENELLKMKLSLLRGKNEKDG